MTDHNLSILHMLIKTTLVFIVLLILTRLLGRKQINHLTFFNYVAGITIGSIAANVVSLTTAPYIDEIIGLLWWCLLTAIIDIINLKSGTIRSIIDGEPSILIKNGKIMINAMKKSRINMDDLSMLLREQNIFSIKEVQYAIFEPNGFLSVMKRPQEQQVTKADMKIPAQPLKYIPSEIIVDGKIIKHNLKELNLDESWLYDQLKQQNISFIDDVFYAEIQNDGSLWIDKK